MPTYYYKVVVDLLPPGVEGIGFILTNGSANQSIGRYAVSIDSFELLPESILSSRCGFC